MDRTRPVGYRRLSLAIGLAALLLAFILFRFGPFQRPLPPSSAPVPPAVPPPSITDHLSPILVDDFETGQTQGIFGERKNRLDAFQGTWARRPSYTVITKVLDTRPGSVGYALRLEYNKAGGWCGWYTLLNGIDVSKLNALTFWVKGERGGERFDIGLADDSMQDLEIDAVYVGPVMAFLQEGVTAEWQKVKIPLHSLRSQLNLGRMGSLVLWFRYEGAGAIQIDDVAFAYNEEVEQIQRENAPTAQKDKRAPRATWVWKVDPVNNAEVRNELFAFCEKTAIQRIYIYLGEDPVSKNSLEPAQNLAAFLRECHTRGIEVHALQGNPLWALKPYHPKVLAWIGGYLEFNQSRPPEEWIDGVHMDIEPYLTQEWESGDRDKLQTEFIELMKACRQLIDNEAARRNVIPAKAGNPRVREGPRFREDDKVADSRPWALGPMAQKPFVMGLAIPVFYSREPEMEEKLLSTLDYAALMDYYDTARDIIDNAAFHLAMAGRLGIEMVVGVETQDLVEMNQGKRRNTFVEEGWEEMERELKKVVDTFAGQPGFGGLAVHSYESYRLLQRGRNVPTRERSAKIPLLTATRAAGPIQMDGDLSEWLGAAWTQVDKKEQVVYGVGAWGWGQDLSFKTAVRWEPKALVIAFDVTDNQLIQEKKGAEMWEGDHIELWLDADLDRDFSEAVNSSDDFQMGLSPGNFKNLPPEVHVWVPSVDPASVGQVELAAKQNPAGYTMEVRLPASFIFQNVEKRVGVDPGAVALPKGVSVEQMALQNGVLTSETFKVGFRLGIMVDGSDCDAVHQPQKCLLSTSTQRQWGDPTTFNILELK